MVGLGVVVLGVVTVVGIVVVPATEKQYSAHKQFNKIWKSKYLSWISNHDNENYVLTPTSIPHTSGLSEITRELFI